MSGKIIALRPLIKLTPNPLAVSYQIVVSFPLPPGEREFASIIAIIKNAPKCQDTRFVLGKFVAGHYWDLGGLPSAYAKSPLASLKKKGVLV